MSSDIKVLVVDDDLGILESFKYMLEDICELILARNGEDALYSLNIERPNLVFLDIKMPDINGLDILKFIRNRYSDLKVVIITATQEEENIEIAMELGVEYYLRKPLDVFHIRNIIDSFLN